MGHNENPTLYKGVNMFGYNYKIKPVNIDKGIYKLSPTKGTLAKAFAPALVFFVGAALVGAYNEMKTGSVVELDPDHDNRKS